MTGAKPRHVPDEIEVIDLLRDNGKGDVRPAGVANVTLPTV
jgi:hypothetical protein